MLYMNYISMHLRKRQGINQCAKVDPAFGKSMHDTLWNTILRSQANISLQGDRAIAFFL